MMRELQAGETYHCNHCHKSYRYRGEVTGCIGADCCHGADVQLTPDEIWKEKKDRVKTILQNSEIIKKRVGYKE